MRFDDLSADGQAKAQSDIPRGEERRRSFFRGFRRKTPAVILYFDLETLARAAIDIGVSLKPDTNFGIGRIGLQGIEHDFGESVFKRGAIAGEDNWCFAGVVFKLAAARRLVLARFLVSFLQKWGQGEGFVRDERIASEKAHLVDQ